MNNPIGLICSLRQLEAFRSQYSRGRIASAHLDVCSVVGDEPNGTVHLWNYINAKEMYANWLLSFDLCHRMAETLQGRLVVDDCDVISHMRQDWQGDLAGMLNAELVLQRLVNDHLPERLTIVKEKTRAGYLFPAPRQFFFVAVAEWIAHTNGISFDSIELDYEGDATLSSPDAAAGVKPWRELAENIRVLSVCEGLTCKEQAAMADRLEKEGRSDWLVAAVGPFSRSVPHVSLDHLRRLPFAGPGKPELKTLWEEECWPRLCGELGDEFPFIFNQQEMSWLSAYAGHWLHHGRRSYQAARFLLEGVRPAAVLQGFDHDGYRRLSAEAYRRAGIPVVVMDHAGLYKKQEAMWNQGGRCHVAVWGRSGVEAQKEWRSDAARIEQVGSLRSDHEWLHLGTDSEPPALKRGDPDHPTIVLVVGRSGFATHFFSDVDWGKLCDSWAGVLQVIDRHPDWRWIIKLHPRSDYEKFYDSLLRRKGEERTYVSVDRRPLSDVLPKAAVAVLFNTASQSAVDAIGSGVPVIYLDEAVNCFCDSPVAHGAGRCVHNPLELEAMLSSVIEDSAVAADIHGRGWSWLQQHVVATGEAAAERMLGVLESMADSGSHNGDVEPGARWLLDMIRAIEQTCWADADLDRVRGVFRQLRRRGRQNSTASPAFLNPVELGPYLLNLATWTPRCASASISRPRLIALVYQCLPKSMKPSLFALRPYLVRACEEEALLAGVAGKRVGWHIAEHLLAPKRCVRRSTSCT
jgi:hypothetical protein